MISKSDTSPDSAYEEPLMSPQAAQQAFLSAATESKVRRAMVLIEQRALRDLDEGEDNSKWVELYLSYVVGKPRMAPKTVRSIDLGPIQDAAGVVSAIATMSARLAAGPVAEGELSAYSGVIKLAIDAVRVQQGDALADALEGLDDRVFFGRASGSIDQKVRDYAEHLQSEGSDGN